jgi:hypothetical protein
MPTLGIILYALDIQFVYTEYGLDTIAQQYKETSELTLEYCNV